ncbi:Hypothetical predicted protein [Olea europaea subsp. europaea]|uniref:Uncharacterized protein n=1 Tax=Olea europaea subsp. europaea TaxID=158383 RepID=A0A8S0V8U2_OLEEU|nr:Hypothetical predicted protein [Olea europaea subsp. europaea]
MYKYPLNCFCITISNLSFIFFVLPIYLYSIFPQKFELISCGLIFSLNSEMEIDFLGLISKQSQKLEKGRRKNTFKDSAIRGADISLSLSTISSSVDLKGEPLSFGEINGWTVPINKMIPTCEGSLEKDHAREKLSRACVQTPINKLSSTTGFPYDLNEKPTDSRLSLYSNGGNGSEGNLGQIFGEAHASIDTYKDSKCYQKITRCNQFSNLECK